MLWHTSEPGRVTAITISSEWHCDDGHPTTTHFGLRHRDRRITCMPTEGSSSQRHCRLTCVLTEGSLSQRLQENLCAVFGSGGGGGGGDKSRQKSMVGGYRILLELQKDAIGCSLHYGLLEQERYKNSPEARLDKKHAFTMGLPSPWACLHLGLAFTG